MLPKTPSFSTTTQERFWAKVDKSSDCWNWTGSIHKAGYGRFWDGEKVDATHRVSYKIAHGSIPEGMQVDHICRNRQCVNPLHLRLATVKQNAENLARIRTNTSSGIRGVHKCGNRWNVKVMHRGQTYYGGAFATPEEAEPVAIALRNRLFTHNNPDKVATP